VFQKQSPIRQVGGFQMVICSSNVYDTIMALVMVVMLMDGWMDGWMMEY